jgi:hypothetical protein
LQPALAAQRIAMVMNAARGQRVTGVHLELANLLT